MPGGIRGWTRHRLGPSRSSPESSPACGSLECSGSTRAGEHLSRPGSRARCGQWLAMPRGSPPPVHGPPGYSAHKPGPPESWWKRCLAAKGERQPRWVMKTVHCRIWVSGYSACLGWVYIALSVNTNLNILCLDITFNHFGAKPCEDAQKEALDSYAHTPLGPASALHSLLLPHVLKWLVCIAVALLFILCIILLISLYVMQS